MKFRVDVNEYGLSIVDLLNDDDNEYYEYNRVVAANNSDSEWYNSSTHRLTMVNDTALKLENVDVDTSQLPSATEKGFTSAVYTTMYTVNNNQLTMSMNGTVFYDSKTANIDNKCTLKRVG